MRPGCPLCDDPPSGWILMEKDGARRVAAVCASHLSRLRKLRSDMSFSFQEISRDEWVVAEVLLS